MDKRSVLKFVRKWKKVDDFDRKEMQNLSFEDKFTKLSSIFNMAVGLKMNLEETREKDKVRHRWLLLKRGL